MTIESYLQIVPNYTFPDHIVARAMGMYGIEAGSRAFRPNDKGIEDDEWVRKKDLAEAYMWEAAALTFNGGGERVSIGNRSYAHSTQSLSRDDRQTFLDKASSLRAKWGAEAPEMGEPLIYSGTLLW